jgi:hypothetical protein
MPSVLESGNLHLCSQEASTYRAAAQRLHEACEMGLDLTQPISIENWIFLEIAHAALAGDLSLLDCVVAKIEAEMESRTLRNSTREAAERTASSQERAKAPVAETGGCSDPTRLDANGRTRARTGHSSGSTT